MKRMLAVLMAVMTVAAAQTLTADTIYSYRSTPSGTTGFRSGYAWTGGAKPTAGNDYVLTNDVRCGQYGSGQASSVDVFGGESLQIGVAGGNAGTLRYNSYGKVRIAHLILVNGSVIDGDGSSSTMTFDGGMTEVLKTDAPFKFGAENYRGYAFTNGHQFKGEENVTLRLDADNRDLTLGSGSPEYYGKMVLQCSALSLGAPDAFGGPRTEPTADAIKFERWQTTDETVTFNFSGDMTTANRGITLSTGTTTFKVPAGKVVKCPLPITGGSTLTVSGGGTLMLGAVSTPTLNLTAGTTCVTGFGGSTLKLAAGAKFGALVNDDGTVTPTEIPEGVTLTLPADGKIPVRVYGGLLPLTNSNIKVAVMTVPTSIKPNLSKEDVVLEVDASADLGLATAKDVVVESDGTIQTVYLVLACNVVYYSTVNNSYAAWNQAAQYWSDKQSVHNTADYVIGAVPGCTWLRGENNFGGRSITFVKGATLNVKGSNSSSATANLRLMPGATALNNTPSSPNVFTGTITLPGSANDEQVKFQNYSAGKDTLVKSVLSGTGPVRFVNDLGSTTSTCTLSGDNSAYTGAMEFYGGNNGRAIAVSIADEKNLGGNPPVFNAKQVHFTATDNNQGTSNRSQIKATASFDIDDPNRGITVDVKGFAFNVGSGINLGVCVPMVLNQAAIKLGEGTLGLGGAVSGSAKTLTVSAGSVMPRSKEGITSFTTITFASGTGIDLALYPADEDVKADGLYVTSATAVKFSGTTIPVTVRGVIDAEKGTVKLGILNVPSSMADDVEAKLQGNVAFVKDGSTRRRPLPLVREDLEGDRVRFSTEVAPQGLILVVE